MTPVPDHAWLLVRGNIWGPFPTGENFLVCVDYFSRFPSAEIVRKITDSVFTLKLRKLFCHYGALVEMITDNGPQFTSSEFKQLMKEFNIRHCLIIPYHPYSSGEVERFNHILKKLFKQLLPKIKTSILPLKTSYGTTERHSITAWKVSRYGVFSGSYFPAFGLNTERYFVSLHIQSECEKIRTRKYSVFGHISHSACFYRGCFKFAV